MPKLAQFFAVFLSFAAVGARVDAQNPLRHPVDGVEACFARGQPVVGYSLRVTPGDLSGFDVEMTIRNAPDTFRLAMAAHPEYDDRYWRYVVNLSVATPSGPATVTREDSALWRVIAKGGEAVARYRIKLPTAEGAQRGAWRPFIAPTGALVGGPHAFMYMLGATLTPSHVRIDVPEDWEIATGLEPTSDAHVFFAPTVDVLIDSPVLAGKLRKWSFLTEGVPHRIVYWPLPGSAPFDTAHLVEGVRGLTQQAIALFGRAPYREYTFLFQDGAYGALEHLNSVTIGAPSAELGSDPSDLLEEVAHEYFHAWNMMRIRPVERTGVDYRPAAPSRGLWFSEGLSIFYADLLMRRAHIHMRDSTRISQLQNSIARYLGNSSNSKISPERSSLAAYGPTPGTLGDYSPSVHLQGELIGVMLDLIIRDATNGSRSIDDVMRSMLERFSGERGFAGKDVEQAVADVCGCQVKGFFDSYVRGTTPIDFDRYLRLIGMRTQVTWGPSVDDSGKPQLDYRIWAWSPAGEQRLSLLVGDPGSVWAKAGLHTGDRLISVNGGPIRGLNEFRATLRGMTMGQTLNFQVMRATGPVTVKVTASGFHRPMVAIDSLPAVSDRMRGIRARWLSSLP